MIKNNKRKVLFISFVIFTYYKLLFYGNYRYRMIRILLCIQLFVHLFIYLIVNKILFIKILKLLSLKGIKCCKKIKNTETLFYVNYSFFPRKS